MFVHNWNTDINDATVLGVILCLMILGFNHIWI